MVSAMPARSSWPSSPPPGSLETAVGLVLAQALGVRPRVWAVLSGHLLGVDGGAPWTVAEAAASVGRPPGWVQGLLPRVRMVARHAGPPESLVEAVRVLEAGPVRTAAEATAALLAAGVCTGPVHPGGVIRAAQVLGAGCRAQLLTVDPAVDHGGADGRAGGVEEVVAPVGRVALERSVMAGVVAADRRGDVVDLVAVAGEVGVPVVVVRALVEREAGWRIHDGGDGSWWAWRQPLVRKRGVVTSVAVRLSSARGYDAEELRAAVVEVLDGLPPTTKPQAPVPPAARVLAAWLTAQGLLEPAPQADGGGVLRSAPGLALGSDVVLLEAVATAAGRASSAQLAAGLRAAGYSPSTSAQLARTCPVLRRVGRGLYAPR